MNGDIEQEIDELRREIDAAKIEDVRRRREIYDKERRLLELEAARQKAAKSRDVARGVRYRAYLHSRDQNIQIVGVEGGYIGALTPGKIERLLKLETGTGKTACAIIAAMAIKWLDKATETEQ